MPALPGATKQYCEEGTADPATWLGNILTWTSELTRTRKKSLAPGLYSMGMPFWMLFWTTAGAPHVQMPGGRPRFSGAQGTVVYSLVDQWQLGHLISLATGKANIQWPHCTWPLTCHVKVDRRETKSTVYVGGRSCQHIQVFLPCALSGTAAYLSRRWFPDSFLRSSCCP